MSRIQEIDESLTQCANMLAILRSSLEQVPWHRALLSAERSILRCKARLERDREWLVKERSKTRRAKR